MKDILPLLEIDKENSKPVKVKTEKEEVLNVKNKTIAEAKRLLQSQGFRVIFENIVNPTEAVVKSQTPKPGETLEKGSKIYLYINDAEKEKVIVPDLIGKNISNAKDILKKQDLNYNIKEGITKIKKQNIKNGTNVERGTIIVLE